MTTLSDLIDRVEQMLEDTGNATWSAAEITEALRQALEAYSQHLPRRAVSALTLTASGREVDISSLSYMTIEQVWWQYDSAARGYPPKWRDFEVWPGDILYIDDGDEPAAGDAVRIWYTAPHTLQGLDSATATTVPSWHWGFLVQGAAGLAVRQREPGIAETANVNAAAPDALRAWSDRQIAAFAGALRTLARQAATLASGGAVAPALDRWDGKVW